MQIEELEEPERIIQLQTIKTLAQLHVVPQSKIARINPTDYIEIVKAY